MTPLLPLPVPWMRLATTVFPTCGCPGCPCRVYLLTQLDVDGLPFRVGVVLGKN